MASWGSCHSRSTSSTLLPLETPSFSLLTKPRDITTHLHGNMGILRDQNESGGPVVKLVQGIAAGIGLASESIQHRKGKKIQKRLERETEDETERGISYRDTQPEETSVGPVDQDEAAWQLDDMQAELTADPVPPKMEGYAGSSKAAQSFDDAATSPMDAPGLAENFIHEHPPPAYSLTAPAPARRLELPVVLTQRRPKARARGFVRAYAPILEDVGIDEPTFLDFVDQLNKATLPSPWIQAINLAALAVQHVPEPVSIAVGIACKTVADAASETHSRTKTNSFLDKVNEEFFKPRGLVALLMTWKPSDPSLTTNVDFNLDSTITSAAASSSTQGGPSSFSLGKLSRRMQSSSGATTFEFPQTAPLIFPALDDLAASTAGDSEAEARKQSAVSRGGSFVADYMDRRAVAKWAGDNPESGMANAVPKPEFKSRYADPTHPASSGDLLALVTGGKVSRTSLGETRRSLSGRSGRGVLAGLGTRGSGRGGLDRGSILRSRMEALEARGHDRGAARGDGRAHAGGSERSVGRGGIGGTGVGPLSLVGGVKKLLQTVSIFPCVLARIGVELLNLANNLTGRVVPHDRQSSHGAGDG